MVLENLNLPDDATVFKVERIKKIQERIFALENNLIPNEIANRFSVQELKEKSFGASTMPSPRQKPTICGI